MRARESGGCYAYSKADGTAYMLRRSEYPRLLQDWMAGRAFFTGLAFYGSELTLKLGDIVAVSDVTPEQMTAQREDRVADERDDALSG